MSVIEVNKIEGGDLIHIAKVDRYKIDGREYNTKDWGFTLTGHDARDLLNKLIAPDVLSEGARVHAALGVMIAEYEGFDGADTYGTTREGKPVSVRVQVTSIPDPAT